MCNDRRRFISYREADEEDIIYAGDNIVPIMGFRSIQVVLECPDVPNGRVITLEDVAFVPTFHTTVASLRKFNLRKVF